MLEARHLELQAQTRAALSSHDPREGESDASLLATLQALQLFRHLAAPLDVRALCVVREELGYRHPGLDAVLAVQGLGSYPLALKGVEPALHAMAVAGKAVFAFALTEAEAGSDVGALATTAKKEGSSYVLCGTKRFISNAGIATHYTVFARAPAGITAFLVPAETQGLSVKPMRLLADHPIGEVTLEGCRVPEAARIGDEGGGMRLALGTLDVFRATVGAAAVGMARRALDEAVAYAKTRRQFGAPLADLQGVQFLLAESAAELEASRLLVHAAAAAKDQGQERVTYEAAVAKLFSTEAAQRIIDRCLQIHGGNGVVKGFAVERLYRDIRALRIYEGASEVQKVVIARHLLRS